jgi:hypothetical protein
MATAGAAIALKTVVAEGITAAAVMPQITATLPAAAVAGQFAGVAEQLAGVVVKHAAAGRQFAPAAAADMQR